MNVEAIELAAAALGPKLLADVAFLGAAAMPLWITEAGAPPPRPTRDVDVIVEVLSLGAYYRLGEKLRDQEFEENPDVRQLCAWKHRRYGLELDVMPIDEHILGFSNRWYGDALRTATDVALPSGAVIRAVTPPYLLATKLEAFKGRGRGTGGALDYLGSRDFGDIVALIDGRARFIEEVGVSEPAVRTAIADDFRLMRADFRFEGAGAGALMPDNASQARRSLVLERIDQMIAAQSA